MPINHFDTANGIAGFSQRDYQTEAHAHFSIEVAFSLSGSLTIRTADQEYSKIPSAIIGSNVRHIFSCIGECQLYFIDPTATVGEHILKDYQVDNKNLLSLDAIAAEKLKEKFNFMVSEFNQSSTLPKHRDDRIQKCLDWIEANHAVEGISLSRLSEELFLSESRLAHLFKENIGIPIHQYILWKKIEAAAKKSLEGHSLTECAHYAGFTDSSHFNKTFKKMFGVKPFFALKQ